MEQFNSIVNQNLGWVHENKYVLPVISLFLGMYAALARPKLPKFITKLFENPVFRLVMISYIIYRGNKDPQLSLMIAAAFLITMHMINKQKVESLNIKQRVNPSPSFEACSEGICTKSFEPFEACSEGICKSFEPFEACSEGICPKSFESFEACSEGICPKSFESFEACSEGICNSFESFEACSEGICPKSFESFDGCPEGICPKSFESFDGCPEGICPIP